MTLAPPPGMHGSTLGHLFVNLRHGVQGSTSEPCVVRERKVTATALTLTSALFGVVIGIRWGGDGLACYLPWLPIAFVLLWGSTTALRFDDLEEAERLAPEPAQEPIAELHPAEARG